MSQYTNKSFPKSQDDSSRHLPSHFPILNNNNWYEWKSLMKIELGYWGVWYVVDPLNPLPLPQPLVGLATHPVHEAKYPQHGLLFSAIDPPEDPTTLLSPPVQAFRKAPTVSSVTQSSKVEKPPRDYTEDCYQAVRLLTRYLSKPLFRCFA